MNGSRCFYTMQFIAERVTNRYHVYVNKVYERLPRCKILPGSAKFACIPCRGSIHQICTRD